MTLMFYYLLPSNVLLPPASSVGRSEAPKAFSESHHSLPRGNPAVISDILYNLEKSFFFYYYRGFPVMADENGHRV